MTAYMCLAKKNDAKLTNPNMRRLISLLASRHTILVKSNRIPPLDPEVVFNWALCHADMRDPGFCVPGIILRSHAIMNDNCSESAAKNNSPADAAEGD